MNDPTRERLLQRLGYQFNNTQLLDLALTHRSRGAANNERLEFLGDSLLSTIISEALYLQYGRASEGKLSRIRSQLVKGETLATLAREFDLGESLILGEGEMKSGGHRRSSILADTLEAVIAAIYLDSGFASCRERVLDWYRDRLHAIDLDASQKDPKTELQEFLQSRGQPLPVYQLEKVSGRAHAQQFTVSCTVQALPQPVTSRAGSRRQAEKSAALEALVQLKKG